MHFDRVLECNPGNSLLAEKQVLSSAPYFSDHFPLNPVLPLTILLECKVNLALHFAEISGWSEFRVKELRKIKMNAFVKPGKLLKTLLVVKKQDNEEIILGFKTEVDDKRVCIVDLIMTSGNLND
jgi:3-hydroxymyristoyl/3-hydroxydecanoyl-(acyl carrier protein) dehydratase